MKQRVKPIRRPAKSDASYLEYSAKVVKGPRVVSEQYEVQGCACRSRYCVNCAQARGYALRQRILTNSVAMHWRNVQMWTFTVDPENFESPQAALEHFRSQRVVSSVVRSLRKCGALKDRHYFVVVEWQKNGWPHWHLLWNAYRVDFWTVLKYYNRFVPEAVVERLRREYHAYGWPRDEVVKLLRAGLGSVCFTKGGSSAKRGSFDGSSHAINYATKYICKLPADGFPDWVMRSRKNIPRYSSSRGFFLDTENRSQSQKGDGDSDESDQRPERPTIADRVKSCRRQAVIVVTQIIEVDGVQTRYRRFVGCTALPRSACAELLGYHKDAFSFFCPAERVHELLGHRTLSDDDEDCRETDRDRVGNWQENNAERSCAC